jgi:hypothetical protein
VTPLRLLRIAAIAIAFALVFTASQQATLARYGETTPGLRWAIGVLTVLFLAGAWATERTHGPDANVRKDMLWGLAAGGVGILVNPV